MANEEVILRFNKVSFQYGPNQPILQEAEFSLRNGTKLALMGQNGAGKSTILNLITNALMPESGAISMRNGLTIATAKQTISPDQMDLTIREFFQGFFKKKIHEIDARIEKVFEVVHLVAAPEKKVRELSGGQQARLLLASALIQDPDLLMLDEPTNNLDTEGRAHLTQFLQEYPKTCIVISHDAEFLNAFTQGVVYLDVFTRQIEQYTGNYFDVVREIAARIERERMKNVRL
jgi:ATPase subunit of ABC transporter with duplicated ATPase domains